jgi:hypothetical protein
MLTLSSCCAGFNSLLVGEPKTFIFAVSRYSWRPAGVELLELGMGGALQIVEQNVILELVRVRGALVLLLHRRLPLVARPSTAAHGARVRGGKSGGNPKLRNSRVSVHSTVSLKRVDHFCIFVKDGRGTKSTPIEERLL